MRRESIAAGTRPIMSEQSADSDWLKMSPLLDEALCRLSAKERNLICLRFLQEKSIREVAEALGTSESAAGKRIERAVARLRRDFADRGVLIAGAGLMPAASFDAGSCGGQLPGMLDGIVQADWQKVSHCTLRRRQRARLFWQKESSSWRQQKRPRWQPPSFFYCWSADLRCMC